MRVLNTRNVHEALPEAIRIIDEHGVEKGSRNGPVKVLAEPLATVYEKPQERVMFWAVRDANPFFHLFESLWMIGGRNDVSWLSQFNSNIKNYSDDGATFHGAYGYRWRNWFGFDQLECIIEALKLDHTDRRQMLQMWDAQADLKDQAVKKDIPCNTIAHFQVNVETGHLDMSVFNRSNDIVWGCYGANAVHFSFLLEYMADKIGLPMGVYNQISDNWHAYVKTLEPMLSIQEHCRDPLDHEQYPHSPYESGEVWPMPLNAHEGFWDRDLKMFLEEGYNAVGYTTAFFRRTALPMLKAYHTFKHLENEHRYDLAIEECENITSTDWKLACQQWLQRRRDKFFKAKDDGADHG